MSRAEYRANEDAEELGKPIEAARDIENAVKDIQDASEKLKEVSSKSAAASASGQKAGQTAAGDAAGGTTAAAPEAATSVGTASGAAGGGAEAVAEGAGSAAAKGFGKAIESIGSEFLASVGAALAPVIGILTAVFAALMFVVLMFTFFAALDSDPRITLFGGGGVHRTSEYEVTNTFITRQSCPTAYQVFLSLCHNGFTPEAAAGIVGNFFQEVGGGGTTDLNGSLDLNNAIGFAMWTGGNRTRFIRYCTSRGLDRNSIDVQVGYLVYTLDNGEWYHGTKSENALLQAGYLAKPFSVQELKSCTDVDQATAAFLACYEECIRGVEDGYRGAINGIHMTRAQRCDFEYGVRVSAARASYMQFTDP